MKALSIIGIVLSVVFFALMILGIDELRCSTYSFDGGASVNISSNDAFVIAKTAGTIFCAFLLTISIACYIAGNRINMLKKELEKE